MLSSDILNLFSPGISDQVDVLITEGKVGICSGLLRIADVGTGCSVAAKRASLDRFKLTIPFAGQHITWEILFNSSRPEEPPDFIFGADDMDFNPDVDNLPSLVQWSPDNSGSLLAVLQELLLEYKKYQQHLIDQNSRLQFEYMSLKEQGGFTDHELEVHVTHKNTMRFGPISFLLKLPVDFSGLPAYLTKDNPGEDVAVLAVTFQTAEGGKVTPQLYLSPRVEHCLGGSASLRIPAFHNGGCLIDYVPTVTELLKTKVDHVVQTFMKKRECISALLALFGRSVIEYDTEAFTKVSFLLEWHDFFFVFTVELLRQFPVEPPVYTFQSVYHEGSHGQPYVRVSRDMPYSPRWGATELAERTRTYIQKNVSDFQKGSVMEGTLQQPH